MANSRTERTERLAAALRENLRRRKAQTRARAQEAPGDGEADETAGTVSTESTGGEDR